MAGPLVTALGAKVSGELVELIMMATSLGIRTYIDNKEIEAEVMSAALAEDPNAALRALIARYDDVITSELQRSKELRGVA